MGRQLCGMATKKPFKKSKNHTPPLAPFSVEVSEREKQRLLAPPTPAPVAGVRRPSQHQGAGLAWGAGLNADSWDLSQGIASGSLCVDLGVCILRRFLRKLKVKTHWQGF